MGFEIYLPEQETEEIDEEFRFEIFAVTSSGLVNLKFSKPIKLLDSESLKPYNQIFQFAIIDGNTRNALIGTEWDCISAS